jgi:hypothetical protein
MKKCKMYLDVQVTRNDNSMFTNPLKLSEVYLINKLAKEHKSIKVTLEECSDSQYKSIFG